MFFVACKQGGRGVRRPGSFFELGDQASIRPALTALGHVLFDGALGGVVVCAFLEQVLNLAVREIFHEEINAE